MRNVITLIFVLKLLEVASLATKINLQHNQIRVTRPFGMRVQRNNNALPSQKSDDSSTNVEHKDFGVTILGVTGGIGSGKSSACQILASPEFQTIHNCEVYHIDSDSLAHSVYAPGSQAILEIRSEFGDEVVSIDKTNDGEDSMITINRKNLGAIVFSDSKAMSKLEQIVWPHVKTKVLEKVEEISNIRTASPGKPKVIILEAAVLLDANWSSLLSALWVIKVSSSTASARLVSNRNISEEDALTRIKAQETRRGIGNLEEEIEKKEVNAVIENDGTVEDLKERLEKTWLDSESWRDYKAPLGEITKTKSI